MTRDKALERIGKLLALAAPGSGATEEEARTAAVQAARLMAEHGLGPGADQSGAGSFLTGNLEALFLQLRVAELERVLGERQQQRLREIHDDNLRWSRVLEYARAKERSVARRQTKKVARQAATKERENVARRGGRARARNLDPERRVEIAREAARARWARWRERHQA